MKKIALALVILSFSSAAYCGDWTTTNTVLQLGTVGLALVDLNQTLWMCNEGKWDRKITAKEMYVPYDLKRYKNTDKRNWYFQETNYFMKGTPSREKVIWTFTWQWSLQFGIAYFLPSPFREIYQVASLLWEAMFVGTNHLNGVKCAYLPRMQSLGCGRIA